MGQLAPPETFFGLPLTIRRPDAEQLRDALEVLWHRQFHREPRDLDADLDALKLFFDPLTPGGKLRERLTALPAPPLAKARLLAPPLILTDGGESLVTLEGRSALSVLRGLLGEDPGAFLVIDPDTLYRAEHRVYSRYQVWSQQRIRRVLRLIEGRAEAISPASVGFALLLLVNGSRSNETAMRRLIAPKNSGSPAQLEGDQERLDVAVSAPVQAFCASLGETVPETRHISLYSGYVPTEARRRLAGILGPEPDRFYVRAGLEQQLISRLASTLRRPKRSPETGRVLSAFDELVATYRKCLPVFASLGLAHERREETIRIREQLGEALNGDR